MLLINAIHDSEILAAVNRIEVSVVKALQQIDKKLESGEAMFRLFDNGLRAYKESVLHDTKVSQKQILHHQYLEQIRTDKDVSFPHRKILEFLLTQYDFSTGLFREVHFSKLVKESRVGKNRAKCYLSLLENKGLICKREDGYRKLFNVRLPEQ